MTPLRLHVDLCFLVRLGRERHVDVRPGDLRGCAYPHQLVGDRDQVAESARMTNRIIRPASMGMLRNMGLLVPGKLLGFFAYETAGHESRRGAESRVALTPVQLTSRTRDAAHISRGR